MEECRVRIIGLHTGKDPVSTKETMARVTIMARASKGTITSPPITTSPINIMADPPTTVAAEGTEAAEDTTAEGAIAEAVIATSANITKTSTLPETRVDTVVTEIDSAALLRVRRSPLSDEVPFGDRGYGRRSSAGGMGKELVSIH